MANSKEITMILKGSELERALELDNSSRNVWWKPNSVNRANSACN